MGEDLAFPPISKNSEGRYRTFDRVECDDRHGKHVAGAPDKNSVNHMVTEHTSSPQLQPLQPVIRREGIFHGLDSWRQRQEGCAPER